jgi:hypothetical protein
MVHLVGAFQQPSAGTTFEKVGEQQLVALKQLAEIFQRHTNKPHRALQKIPMKTMAELPRVVHTTRPPHPDPPRPTPTLPRVESPTSPIQHRYPTWHTITQTQEEENHCITRMPCPQAELLSTHCSPIAQWASAIIDRETGATMEYRHLQKSPKHKQTWTTSFVNELGRLTQGVGGRVQGTNTVYFWPYRDIADNWRGDVTYGRIVVGFRPQKEEPYRTRLTVGGNLIDYPGNVSTPTADTATEKLVINSVVSTPKAKYMCGDIKNFILARQWNDLNIWNSHFP